MHNDHAVFLTALEQCTKVGLTFYSKEDGGHLVRLCAPLDFGPRSRARDKSPCYHLWDYDSDTGPHVLSLLPAQIVSIAASDDTFDPRELVTWTPRWHHPRDWGALS